MNNKSAPGIQVLGRLEGTWKGEGRELDGINPPAHRADSALHPVQQDQRSSFESTSLAPCGSTALAPVASVSRMIFEMCWFFIANQASIVRRIIAV